jgi:hypothetical protein
MLSRGVHSHVEMRHVHDPMRDVIWFCFDVSGLGRLGYLGSPVRFLFAAGDTKAEATSR